MSFLTIMFFASAFYFVHGRPDAITTPATATVNGAAEDAIYVDAIDLTLPESNSSEATYDTVEQYYEQDFGFIDEMYKAFDEFLMPMMLNFNALLNGLYTQLNGILLLINNNGTENTAKEFDAIESFEGDFGLTLAPPLPETAEEQSQGKEVIEPKDDIIAEAEDVETGSETVTQLKSNQMSIQVDAKELKLGTELQI